jgi:hypothetical protein
MQTARNDYLFGQDVGISVSVNSTVNATQMVQSVLPYNSTANNTNILLSYYQALAESWLGIPIRVANALFGFFQVCFAMGHYLKALIPIIPDELAYLLDVVVGIPWAVGFFQLITGRWIEK